MYLGQHVQGALDQLALDDAYNPRLLQTAVRSVSLEVRLKSVSQCGRLIFSWLLGNLGQHVQGTLDQLALDDAYNPRLLQTAARQVRSVSLEFWLKSAPRLLQADF